MNIFSLLAAGGLTATQETTTKQMFNDAYKTFTGIVNIILPVIAGFVLVLGVILGVKVAVQFAQAEDEEAKKKAKGHLVNIIIGFCVAIVFIAIIAAVLNGEVVAKLFGDQINPDDKGIV